MLLTKIKHLGKVGLYAASISQHPEIIANDLLHIWLSHDFYISKSYKQHQRNLTLHLELNISKCLCQDNILHFLLYLIRCLKLLQYRFKLLHALCRNACKNNCRHSSLHINWTSRYYISHMLSCQAKRLTEGEDSHLWEAERTLKLLIVKRQRQAYTVQSSRKLGIDLWFIPLTFQLPPWLSDSHFLFKWTNK